MDSKSSVSIAPPQASAQAQNSDETPFVSPNRRLFAECPLVEIIHLHDCLRGALHRIQTDLDSLVATAEVINDHPESSEEQTAVTESADTGNKSPKFEIQKANTLSNSVASRFHLIWSVFQAHSGAEDEFIWPALKMKIESKKRNSSSSEWRTATASTDAATSASSTKKCGCESILEQESYEEDHAHEEHMFKQINTTLRRLNGSFRFYHANPQPTALCIIKKCILALKEQTDNLAQHLHQHLEKEETQCLPMVKKHLTNDEISILVGQIMGKRSAEMMSKILNLSVCSLPADEREDMVKCLKKAMGGTFFEKWLTMGGWEKSEVVEESTHGNSVDSESDDDGTAKSNEGSDCATSSTVSRRLTKRKSSGSLDSDNKKKAKFEGHVTDPRLRYPSRYYTKKSGRINLVWNSVEAKKNNISPSEDIPQFAQSELTPTFHFSETDGSMVLGCEHYSRSCKLRHPETDQFFTCRLCCEEIRSQSRHSYEMLPVLNRHEVKEILCMKCGAVQPAAQKCANESCECSKNGFAKYYCSICNLYDDDEKKNIYHCPYCNLCRKGKGLGIDFRHCMRCNACIAISEYDKHICISQRLQSNCPICRESMFESTQPLRGLQCGHVMHLPCYNEYASRCLFGRITCPLCKKVFENTRG